jgi:hypothetical protein
LDRLPVVSRRNTTEPDPTCRQYLVPDRNSRSPAPRVIGASASPLPLKRHEAAIIKRLKGREAAQEAMSNTAYRLSITKSTNHPGPAELTTTIFSHFGNRRVVGLALAWSPASSPPPPRSESGPQPTRRLQLANSSIWKVFAIEAISLSQSGLARLLHRDRRSSNHPKT